jgi:hypothetical protein
VKGQVMAMTDKIQVWDVTTEQGRMVPRREAVEGIMRYAATLPAGSAMRAEWERHALALLRDGTSEVTADVTHRCSNECSHAIRAVDSRGQSWQGGRQT